MAILRPPLIVSIGVGGRKDKNFQESTRLTSQKKIFSFGGMIHYNKRRILIRERMAGQEERDYLHHREHDWLISFLSVLI